MRERAKSAEFCLCNMSKILGAIKECRDEQAYLSLRTYGGRGAGEISNPTMTKALKRLEEVKEVVLNDGTVVRYPERWAKVFALLKASWGETEDYPVFEQLFIHRKTIICAGIETYRSRRSVLDIKSRILYFALGLAESLGIFKNSAGVVRAEPKTSSLKEGIR